MLSRFFFFNDTATTEIYTLSLHDALPISSRVSSLERRRHSCCTSISPSSATNTSLPSASTACAPTVARWPRSEEHTSELQSLAYLVCRLLLEKKKCHTRQ